ncbi:ABC transporter ATP-binding protein [Veillonella sp. YH-vei2232]|jgi:putative ABC transport system ATP-binding protein|uniref:ABC transporter ATP-binding protein n=1 Tax=Veillonella absiana TaxID=3079305 RepID=A0ABU3Z815_9FIRM|nr:MULTISPECIES: ABC transporter ATP-binding protein [unclassified Veillonella]MBK7921892.1 ABC transporter ATP-binding protein [Veillonella sp.]MDV5062639.1 ABC transporter ATP-binding protein [Veillonella sp. YH-vei2232]MDV5088048.1 ABC transporter ATP-binding protein [Veillonella sp. YH-vei2233]NCB95466.1 ABC transporter ATP-binding protein [Negativicutes bacterium]
MITIQGLEKRYKDGDQEIVALHLPYAEFDRGTQWAVVGPSGSGKSTLLHCLAGIIRADGGQIKTGEGILTDFDEDALQSWRSIEIGYIFQDFNLIDALTVKENIELGAYLSLGHYVSGYNKTEQFQERLQHLLETMDIVNLLNKRPSALSRGEQQRVAVARALIKEPSLVLADEPTASLDEENSRRVMDLLTSYCKQSNATLLVATHDPLTKSYCSNVITLTKGGHA